MQKKIGPGFATELFEAGVGGLPFSWGSDGTFLFNDEVTEEQKTTILEVYGAHDPDREVETELGGGD